MLFMVLTSLFSHAAKWFFIIFSCSNLRITPSLRILNKNNKLESELKPNDIFQTFFYQYCFFRAVLIGHFLIPVSYPWK